MAWHTADTAILAEAPRVLFADPARFEGVAGIEVVAMDGFAGFKTATTPTLPAATVVMDPFHVVGLAGHALDECRRRIQQNLYGRRGRKNDPCMRPAGP